MTTRDGNDALTREMASNDLNVVTISGRLTSEPYRKTTKTGAPCTTFEILSSQAYEGAEGIPKQRAAILSVVMFGRVAELAHSQLRLDSRVLLAGALNTYTQRSGGCSDLELRASSFLLLNPPREEDECSESLDDVEPFDENIPF